MSPATRIFGCAKSFLASASSAEAQLYFSQKKFLIFWIHFSPMCVIVFSFFEKSTEYSHSLSLVLYALSFCPNIEFKYFGCIFCFISCLRLLARISCVYFSRFVQRVSAACLCGRSTRKRTPPTTLDGSTGRSVEGDRLRVERSAEAVSRSCLYGPAETYVCQGIECQNKHTHFDGCLVWVDFML